MCALCARIAHGVREDVGAVSDLGARCAWVPSVGATLDELGGL